MNTIKPQLGKGLGECEDINRGKIFPSFKSDFGRDIDNIFACDPILITNKKINKKELRIKSYDCSDIPGMEVILKKFKTNTLIIRPDRFILASTQKNDLLKFTNTCLNQIYSL
jgi:5-methylthioribose kinase